jgi:hemerythrin-like domain-containing protein
MPRMIDILLEEHRNIEKLLAVLEQELHVFDQNDSPDYEILQAVIDYFQHYPEGYHHPKEDILFEKLQLHDPAAAKRIGDVEDEHELESERLNRFAEAVSDILAGREYLRQSFHDLVREFIEYQRQHMDKEERLLFPAAAKALRPEDWAEIDSRIENRKDPLFDGAADRKFQALRQTILRWERETGENRIKARA